MSPDEFIEKEGLKGLVTDYLNALYDGFDPKGTYVKVVREAFVGSLPNWFFKEVLKVQDNETQEYVISEGHTSLEAIQGSVNDFIFGVYNRLVKAGFSEDEAGKILAASLPYCVFQHIKGK